MKRARTYKETTKKGRDEYEKQKRRQKGKLVIMERLEKNRIKVVQKGRMKTIDKENSLGDKKKKIQLHMNRKKRKKKCQ